MVKNNFYGRTHDAETKFKIGKLNLEKIQMIKNMIENKVKIKDIAKLMNVGRHTIQRVKYNKTYTGVTQ